VIIISQVINAAISDAAVANNVDNMKTGNIPAELCQLRSLREFYLSNNDLSGNH